MKFFFLFLALGISFFWNNSLTPIVLSETVGEPKKEQFLDSNAKVIEQFKLKADKSEESSDWINAIKYRRKILTLTKQKYGLKHAETASALNALGFLHNALGEYEKAEVFFKESLEISIKVSGLENIETVKYLNNLGSIYETLGKYEKAEPLLRQSLEIRKSVLGLEHPDTAQALNNLGFLYQSLSEYEKAEPLYRESLEITKSVLGLEHPDTAQALNNLGSLYQSLSEYEKAETLLRQSLEITKNVFGLEHPNTATLLSNLGFLYDALSQYKKAEPLYKESLKIRKRVLGLEHPDTARSFNNLGMLYFAVAEYDRAEPLLRQSLEIRKSVFGLEHPETAQALNNLAGLFEVIGEYEKAEPLYRESLEITKSVFGTSHFETTYALNNLGLLYLSLGEYEKAEPLYKESLEIRKRVLGLEHPDTANSFNNLGLLYKSLGQYEKVEPLYSKSLEIRKKVFGLEHPDTALSLNNLGGLYENLGQYKKAETLYRESLEIRKNVFGLEHPDVVHALNNLGLLYENLGQYKKAEPLLRQSLEITKNIFGLEHPDTASLLSNLGFLYSSLSEYEKAERLYRESLEITKNIFGTDSLETSHTLNNLGLLYLSLGEYEKAEPLLKQSLKISKKGLGLDHPRTVISLNNLSNLYSSVGEYEKANNLMQKALFSRLKFIKKQVAFLPISSRLDFINHYKFNQNLYSNLDKNLSKKELALFTSINTKGILEDIERSQSQFKNLQGKQKEILNKIIKINQKIANIKNNQNEIRDLLLDKEKLEKKLYRLLPTLDDKIVNIENLIEVMPRDSVLVEYVRYTPYMKSKWKSPRYLALVLDPSKMKFYEKGNLSKYKIHAIDLGLAETLENKIQDALIATEEGLSDAPQLLKDLGEIIIKPLATINKESKTWFITPGGELNKIPFAALGGYEGDQLLVDQIKIRLLTTSRELIDLQKKNISKKNNSFVFANPSFDLEREIISEAQPIKSSFELNTSQIRTRDSRNFVWASLPGTAKEGKFIANMINANLLVGDKATAKKIVNTKNPEILHIASHSYYLKNQEKNIESLKYSQITKNSKLLNYFAKNENPLLRSGVVLAGANNPDLNQEDDGYLTAFEITQLDWSGTELVVISGCESGKGDIKNGEGIYGLKRAISVAGARSSLLSLWKVDDEGTAVFMKSFYEKLIKGEGRADALKNTQKEFRNHKNKNYRHPSIWAAFQLSGDWRPIVFKK